MLTKVLMGKLCNREQKTAGQHQEVKMLRGMQKSLRAGGLGKVGVGWNPEQPGLH
jgi:hypothetical protein